MNLRRIGLITFVAVMGCTSLVTARAEALLASVKTTGMAATGVAYPQDSLATAFNPAGMADVGDRIDAGGFWLHLNQKVQVRGNRLPPVNGTFKTSHTANIYAGEGGFNKEFCFCGFNASFGVAVYNRSFLKTTFNRVNPLLGRTRAGLEFIHEIVAPTLAFKVGCIHNFGISLNYSVQRLKVNGIQNFQRLSSVPSATTNRGYDYSNGVGFTVGYRCQILPTLSLGVAYTPKGHMRKFHKYRGFVVDHGKFDTPERVAGGIAWRWSPCSTIAFDVENVQWRDIPQLRNPLSPNLFTSRLGLKDGAGFDWRNQTFYRVGIDYDIWDCLTIRAGYRFARQPIKRTQTAANVLTCETVEQFFTCGATYGFEFCNYCSEFSFFYAHGFDHKVKGKDAIPVLLGGGNVDLEQSQNIVGVSLGVAY